MAKKKDKFDMEAFYSSLKKNNFAPIYFFYGEENFLIEECVDALVEHSVDPSKKEFNFDVLQGSEIDGKRIVAIASSYPMMADRRVVIVKDFERVTAKEFLEPYIENPSQSTVLILVASNPDFRKKPYLTLKKNSFNGEFPTLYDNETIAWIKGRMKLLKRQMEPDAVELLQSFVGNSLQELANEIDKVLIAVGEKLTITVSDIEHVVGVSREFTVFELANKIGEKNLPKALEISERMLNSGESAVGMIAALTNHFIRLWKIHDGLRLNKSEQELMQYVYYNSFALRGAIAQAKKYKAEEIENSFIILAETDLALKSSADPKLTLTKSITEIVSGIVSESVLA
jgi:DNA polymerase III subunit delta